VQGLQVLRNTQAVCNIELRKKRKNDTYDTKRFLQLRRKERRMREILFRGKCKTTGKWFEGHYYSVPAPMVCFAGDAKQDEHYIVFENPHYVPDWNMPREMVRAHVYPETVGQYTGLTDKNGKKIFEGDIVEGHCHSQWNHRLQRCVVAYDRDSFEARHYVMQGGKERYYTYRVLFSKDVEVIGNIRDNPELLEVRE
jgi:uncharacterized phage protein (TIGR01671 family)